MKSRAEFKKTKKPFELKNFKNQQWISQSQHLWIWQPKHFGARETLDSRPQNCFYLLKSEKTVGHCYKYLSQMDKWESKKEL